MRIIRLKANFAERGGKVVRIQRVLALPDRIARSKRTRFVRGRR
jgi:hypothetical protein